MRKRRRSGAEQSTTAEPEMAGEPQAAGAPEADAAGATGGSPRDFRSVHGPWDSSEKPVDPEDETRVDLGALSIQGHPDLELRLQVDQGSGQVTAVMLLAGDGAMELRAYAAPRHEDLWDEFRSRIAGEAAKRGGQSGEVDGPYGTGLHVLMPVTTPEGEKAVQPSTVLGISGPRWLLRVSMFGRPAKEFRPDGVLESALRNVVVNRGSGPMAPGDPIPIVLPAGARPAEAAG